MSVAGKDSTVVSRADAGSVPVSERAGAPASERGSVPVSERAGAPASERGGAGKHDEGDLVELLHSRGQRVTSQRLVILRELRQRGRHATAEEIHRSVQRELPGVSVPTIYATLELFVDLGLARRIETGVAALYDAGTEPHQHAVCRRCGRVQDVGGRLSANALLAAARATGFQPHGAELIITGLCGECAAAMEESAR